METLSYLPREFSAPTTVYASLTEENELLRKEIQVSREAADITANLVVKQFEETEKILRRLQVANAQRKAVLDSAIQISIIATDKDGLITVFNTGAENLLGYRAEEIIGKWTPEIFHLKSELNMVSQNLSSKYGYNVEGINVFYEHAVRDRLAQQEWTYVRKDGTQFPVRMTINTLREPYGSVSGLLFIAMDIAEKRRSEKALLESERKYRLLVRNLPNCVYKGYFDGTIDFFDDKIEQITGYRKEEFLSREMSWFSFVHEEDLKCAEERFKQALRTDNSYIREYRIKSKSGDIIWIQDSGQIIYGENGEVEFITGAFLDITERKLAEKALHESEEKYRSLFNSGPDPIFVLDCTTQKILDANPMAQETYGYLKEDLIGRPFNDLGPLDDIMEGLADFSEDEWPDACAVSSKAEHYKKGDVSFFVRVTACPTRYKDRDAIILAATDITEMLEREAQLLQASKMTSLGKMSAGIAHELNQPLNAINMGSEYLTMMVEEGKKISRENLVEVARQISEQVDRASEIMNRLREFGRKPDFARKKVDLNRAIRIVHGIVAQQLKLQNIIVNLELEENIPFILAHSTRLEQVTFNLVTNAQDAILQKTKDGLESETRESTITIRTFAENNQVAVTVSDNGIGIPENVQHKVFEPFFTTKEVGKGMGLGLSITYGIVKDYNGQIEIQSREGLGTTIKLTFPCADA
jgi:PAS domain S-box-containing protein